MKELLPKLKKLYEAEMQLTNEQVSQILRNSYDFEDYADDFEDLLTDNSVQIKQYKVKEEPVIWLQGLGLHICTEGTFNSIIDKCADEYIETKIDDFLYPFFDRQSYYEACTQDKGLQNVILELADISKWDSSKLGNQEFIIFE